MRTSILCAAPFGGIDLSDKKRRTLPSGVVVLFLPLLFFDHEVVKIARDSFGDCFIGKFGRVIILTRVHLPQSPIKPSVKLNNKLYPNVIRSSEDFAIARRRGVTIIGARVRGRKNVVFTAWHESVKTASIHSEAFWK